MLYSHDRVVLCTHRFNYLDNKSGVLQKSLKNKITRQSHSDNRFVFSDDSFVFLVWKHNKFSHVNVMADLFITRITFFSNDKLFVGRFVFKILKKFLTWDLLTSPYIKSFRFDCMLKSVRFSLFINKKSIMSQLICINVDSFLQNIVIFKFIMQ